MPKLKENRIRKGGIHYTGEQEQRSNNSLAAAASHSEKKHPTVKVFNEARKKFISKFYNTHGEREIGVFLKSANAFHKSQHQNYSHAPAPNNRVMTARSKSNLL